jgi:thiol-disulfide isomerase/thioredoxin
MRALQLFLSSSFLCIGLSAQTPTPATADKPGTVAQAPSSAATRWQELEAKQATRMRGLQRGDAAARETAMKEVVAECEAFAAEFPKTAEASKAWLKVAQIAGMTKDKEAAGKALVALDVEVLDFASVVSAAVLAKRADLMDHQGRLVEAAKKKAKSLDERLELVTAMRAGMQDAEGADKLMAEIEAAATADEDKAMLAMHKARGLRRNKADEYKAALADVVAKFPATKAGKTAAAKLLAAGLAVGSDPVPFTTKDMDGKDVSVADYKGKVLLIDFWATWCGPCMAELPHVLETYQELHDQGFEILGISLDRDTDKDKLLQTIKDRGMSWRHVYDGKWWSAEVAQLHDVNSIPFTLLIGKDGKVAGMSLRGDDLKKAVKAALAAK